MLEKLNSNNKDLTSQNIKCLSKTKQILVKFQKVGFSIISNYSVRDVKEIMYVTI